MRYARGVGLGIPLPESLDPEVLSIRFDRYGTIAVGTVELRPNPFEPSKDIRMGIVKDVVDATTDNSHLGSHFFEKRQGAGTKAAVVGNKENIAVKTGSGFDYAQFCGLRDVSRQEE